MSKLKQGQKKPQNRKKNGLLKAGFAKIITVFLSVLALAYILYQILGTVGIYRYAHFFHH